MQATSALAVCGLRAAETFLLELGVFRRYGGHGWLSLGTP